MFPNLSKILASGTWHGDLVKTVIGQTAIFIPA